MPPPSLPVRSVSINAENNTKQINGEIVSVDSEKKSEKRKRNLISLQKIIIN